MFSRSEVFEVSVFLRYLFSKSVFSRHPPASDILYEDLVFQVLGFWVLAFQVLGLRSWLSRHPFLLYFWVQLVHTLPKPTVKKNINNYNLSKLGRSFDL